MGGGDAVSQGIAQRLPLDLVQHCVDFAASDALLNLRLASRGLNAAAPEFAAPRTITVHFWKTRVGRRTAMYIPKSVSIQVNGYVTLAGVKRKVAAAARISHPKPFEGHILVPGPDGSGEGGGGVLRADGESLHVLPSSARAAALYLVPPPLESGTVAPLVVIPKHGQGDSFLNRSEFHHVAPSATMAMLAERHQKLGGVGQTFAQSPRGSALPPGVSVSDQGLASGGALFEL